MENLSLDAMKRDVNSLLPAEMGGKETTTKNYMEYMKPPYIFILVPIIFAIMLYYFQPFFVMVDDPKGEEEKILSYQKIAIFSVVLSGFIVGGYYYCYGRVPVKSA